MLRICLGLMSLFALSVPSAVAAQDSNSGFFLGARAGSASVSEELFDDTTTAFEFDGGYRWNGLGIEGGYVTFNDFEDDANSLPVNAELEGYFLGFNGRFNFADQWYVGGRAGAFFWEADGNLTSCIITGTSETCTRVEAGDSGTDFYAGASVGYDFSDAFSLGAAYDFYGAELEADDSDDSSDLDTNVLWLTAEFRF
jgi:OmpA-OmpF porin, OOP family